MRRLCKALPPPLFSEAQAQRVKEPRRWVVSVQLELRVRKDVGALEEWVALRCLRAVAVAGAGAAGQISECQPSKP